MKKSVKNLYYKIIYITYLYWKSGAEIGNKFNK